MLDALDQAREALEADEVPVGCVIIDPKTNYIIARGFNRTNASKDATRHAEMIAIDDLIINRGISPDGCTLYVTCEV